MGFSTVEREVKVCDGCGYIFGKEDTVVELKCKENVFHFHDSQDRGFDCFTYWLDKGRALIGCENDRDLSPEELKTANTVLALIPPSNKHPVGKTNEALAVNNVS